MSSTEIEPIEFLNLNYGKLRDAWAAFFLDQSCDFSAPGFTWEEASESAPITDQERLLKAGELTAVGAGLCVVHYLRTLTKAYRFNRRPDGSLDDHDWPGSAAFALGRGVLEASAVLAWLMDPVLCPGERACRAARIVLWSAKHDRRQHSDPEVWTLADWRAAAESIGLEVKEDRNGKIRVGTADGNPELFSHTKVIKEVFGEEGRELYARWSGVAHQATWALADWISLTIDNYGGRISTDQAQADHLDLAGHVAQLLTTASTAPSGYWGRDKGTFTAATARITAEAQHRAQQLREGNSPPS